MQADFQPIQLPMPGKVVDSLNLSVSGGILMYEALRQRSVINDSEHK
jgi:tRNA G18 (ribose-2'-O)-methylase SpoU